jgi:uncharacterized protein YcbX
MPVTVSALYYYPIKSCGGISVTGADVESRGFRYDRMCMVTDPEGGFLTQRDHPRLALIRPRVVGSTLVLSGPGLADLELELADTGPASTVKVWDDSCLAVDQGDPAGVWLSRFLGVPCRLVRMQKDHVRPIDPDYATGEDDQVGFADGFPFLLISQASLADLNSRLAEPLPMNRFRPNIVVDGCAAFAEDGWKHIRIGDMTFSVVKPCARCVVTTTDQATAERDQEPLRTLATYRQVPNRGVMFGQNLIHRGTGTIRTGDRVDVVSSDHS